jgi:hypothetical protein
MQYFYNGYCFSDRINEFIYNPTLVLDFLKYFQQECQFPRQMLDDNLAIDRGKLTYISGLPNGEPIIYQDMNETPPLNLKRLANRFGVDEMLNTKIGGI